MSLSLCLSCFHALPPDPIIKLCTHFVRGMEKNIEYLLSRINVRVENSERKLMPYINSNKFSTTSTLMVSDITVDPDDIIFLMPFLFATSNRSIPFTSSQKAVNDISKVASVYIKHLVSLLHSTINLSTGSINTLITAFVCSFNINVSVIICLMLSHVQYFAWWSCVKAQLLS